MAQFDLKISEVERFILIYALGSISQNSFPLVVVPLAQRLVSLANGEPPAPGPRVDPPPAAVMEAAPVSPHEPARSLDSDAQERTFTADSITKVGNRLVIKWQGRDKILQASCWESALFPAVLRCVKREATFLLKAVKKGNATYLNVVGVK
jgi:hypothetical protein